MASKNREDEFRPTKGVNGKKFAIGIYIGFFVFCAIFGFGTFYGGVLLSKQKINTNIDREKVRLKIEANQKEPAGVFPGMR